MGNKNENEPASFIVLGFIIGFLIMFIFDCVGWGPVNHISQDTMNTICQNLSPDGKVSVGSIMSGGKLVCKSPTYDNTQNVIFKPNNFDIDK